MTNLLLKMFVKNNHLTTDNKVRQSASTLAGFVCIVCNVILGTAKMIIGTLFGAIAIFADGLNNVTDCGNNVVSLISVKLANKPADKDHPYGHQRIEYIASAIVGVVVLVVAIELASESVSKILNPQQSEFSVITIVVLVLSILVKLWMSIFNKKLGKKYNSELLIATGIDSISDCFATTGVLVAVLISKFTGLVIVDGIMGCVVSVIILFAGIGILKDTLSQLLGQAPNEELIEQISQRVLSYSGVYGLHDLNVHNYGPNKYYASVHVEVDSKVDVMLSHDMIDQIERDFLENTNVIMVIHLDPIVIGDPELDTYKQQVKDIVKQLDQHFEIHDFRMVKGPTHTNLIFDVAIHFDTKLTDSQIVDFIQTEITKQSPNVYVVPTVEKQIK